jgi:hypothetical protein
MAGQGGAPGHQFKRMNTMLGSKGWEQRVTHCVVLSCSAPRGGDNTRA